LELKDKDKLKLRHFREPKPAREVSLIFPKTELKIHIIEALRQTISGVIKGAIVFQNVKIISPITKNNL
jgi:LysR family hydrogen peroxide-inducible transcriptional activator